TYSKVKLINGAQAKNVYWKIEGAVSINNYSVFCGTIICNNGALGAINTGVVLNGRALTTNGALSTTATTAVASSIPTDCATLGIQSLTATDETVKIYPNPVNSSTTIFIEDTSQLKNVELIIFNSLGEIVVNTTITKQETVIDTNGLLSGIYFYKIIGNDKVVQSGKLISQQ
ncbi:MAG: T9SS type A sorting domain-containing protein, partial [Bacteroidia bacterium]